LGATGHEARLTELFAADVRLAAAPASLRPIRRWLGEELGWLAPDVFTDIRLLVNELASNVVRHASLAEGAEVAIALSVRSAVLRVEVCGAGEGFDPSAIPPGWGLLLVQKLADRWEVGTSTGRGCVWFERELPRP